MSLTFILLIIILSVYSVYGTYETPVGNWTNNLGSGLEIKSVKGGILTGTYFSGVGHANGTYPLVGYYSEDLVSWSVSWKNGNLDSKSMTVWVGQYFYSDHMICMWLLNTKVPTMMDRWQSTTTGLDFFGRLN
jgi:hypothetical protein